MQLGRDKVVIGEILRLAVKLEARSSTGTLVSIWQATRRHTAQNGNLYLERCEEFGSQRQYMFV